MAKSIFRLLPVFLLLAMSVESHSHDLYDAWDADVTEIACLMHAESSTEGEAEARPFEREGFAVRTFVVAFHPDAEIPLERVSGIDREPYFISLQVITPSRVGETPINVTKTVVKVGGQEFVPVSDPTWEHDDLPVMYLGASAAQKFVNLLLDGKSPVVTITINDSDSTDVPVATGRVRQAFAMLNACRS